MNIIETKKLTKYYLRGKVLGVKNLNLEIAEGEIFGFIGPNGAGKSTTIRLLLDLIRPTSGKIKVLGLDAHIDTVQIKKQIGYLPGEIFLPESMTGKNCLKYYQGFKSEIDHKYVAGIVKRLDLDLSKKVGDYSKGNKQKLAILLAVMHKPKLLILDEPTSGLDPLNQQEFYSIILETKKWGTTTFLSTHILEEAQRICDRVGIIKDGKLIRIENIDDFKHKNIRDIHIETTQSIPLSELKIPGVTKVERTTSGYHLTTTGTNGALLKSLAKFNIEDIKVSEPSLEEIFMRFYKE
ncbi:ABC transporter [Candidatus Berkelbacteria bacterium CG10_big_fil_rev_8_21_14_0_10_43_13]|uniref:ABC transporter n=1 Tax=Candidatus Berkelbacteria bacterium CG10_big_fil_rev_8_21_14_0_10_43_13 TaxID=1974514 RepID=A0A2H0W768_9BACT|nr:MAG: ABC transporter [Candidatus Berkelbacteria bacterium CG10_big_fil_rev_8_21_14_0_10_43_13]